MEQLPAELAALIEDEPTPEAVGDGTLEVLVSEMLDLKANVEELKELLSATTAKYDVLRKRRIPDKMLELGMIGPDGRGNFSHSSGSKVHLRTEVYTYVKKEYEGQLFSWLRMNGHGDLIRETVHPQTLKAFAKERLEDGEPLPPQVSVTLETVAILKGPKTTEEDA